MSSEPNLDRLRVDKWLWHARFFKTRTLAAEVCKSGRLRLNGRHVSKPSQAVGAGDVLTFSRGERVFIIEVLAIGARRGPAAEARALYKDMSPPPPKKDESPKVAQRDAGTGRPTKAERRATDRLRGDFFEF